jgi:hypothetical protein
MSNATTTVAFCDNHNTTVKWAHPLGRCYTLKVDETRSGIDFSVAHWPGGQRCLMLPTHANFQGRLCHLPTCDGIASLRTRVNGVMKWLAVAGVT